MAVSNTPLTGPLKTICHELDLPKLLGFSPDFLEVRSGDLSADFKVRSRPLRRRGQLDLISISIFLSFLNIFLEVRAGFCSWWVNGDDNYSSPKAKYIMRISCRW